MILPTRPADWDIFCTVIDNYGDIGVCWRLARQLVAEHGVTVRLWVDELAAFAAICPQLDPHRTAQGVHGVEVRQWTTDFPESDPGEVVVEAFACHLPESFVVAMARRDPPPVWINLDYLSAEAWVSGCHALPSPHPRLPLTKYFFFPGFDETTGGLLREAGIGAERQAYCASSAQQAAFWARLGQSPPSAEALLISLFAYENPALADLLAIWAQSGEHGGEQGGMPICCLAPATRSLGLIESFVGHSLRAGDVIRRGLLEIRVLPFVAQDDYDRLLWSCDVNFVRGEDSFVRAQWAARPLLWQIYPQGDDAHQIKLEAFVDRYCAGLSAAAAAAVRRLHREWNGGKPVGNPGGKPAEKCADGQGAGRITAQSWAQWLAVLPELRRHAQAWEINLSKQQDLCTSLFRFARSKL
jgi:uncharacterized repeat protein (TIGR03837 family)